MLSPVNSVGLDTCQWGSQGEEWVKKVNGAAQLTPWRKGSWPLWNGLLKYGGHHYGGPAWGKIVREIQNPLWQTEPCASHKPKDRRYFYSVYLQNQNTLTDALIFLPKAEKHAELFFTVSCIMTMVWTWCRSPFTVYSHPIMTYFPF